MDKSPKYIEMCKAAKEVQNQWKQEYGDFFVSENGRIECWISDNQKGQKIKRGFAINIKKGIIRLSKYIWLPRLNQLIEMAQEIGRRYESVTQDFFDWTKRPYERLSGQPGELFPSMEQIWLAFVMHKKHGKQWDGSNWVKVC